MRNNPVLISLLTSSKCYSHPFSKLQENTYASQLAPDLPKATANSFKKQTNTPFAYFSNYKIIQKESDAVAKPKSEYRFSASVELQHELANRFFIIDRTAIEYRVFEGAIENTTRLRNRLAFRYDFNSKYNLAIGDEILFNTTGTDAQHLFDHNRASTNFSYKPNSAVKFDIGYIYISRLTKSNIDLIAENNFYLNFTFTLHEEPRS